MFEIGAELGLDKETTFNIIDYLKGEGLLKPQATGGFIGITHPGIKEVEAALTHPEQPTEHFLPFNVIQVGTMVNSQIQQASPGATQMIIVNPEEREQLEEILKSLKEWIRGVYLEEQARTEAQADIATIESQISSSKPKKSIIIESLKSILSGAAGSLLASGLVQQISTWIGR